jgi:hypothetical protein
MTLQELLSLFLATGADTLLNFTEFFIVSPNSSPRVHSDFGFDYSWFLRLCPFMLQLEYLEVLFLDPYGRSPFSLVDQRTRVPRHQGSLILGRNYFCERRFLLRFS